MPCGPLSALVTFSDRAPMSLVTALCPLSELFSPLNLNELRGARNFLLYRSYCAISPGARCANCSLLTGDPAPQQAQQ